MVPLFIFDFVDHQCFHEYFIGKKRLFHSFRAEVALLRYIIFYCELGCDTSEPHVSYISRACSSLVRQPYYIPNRFILKISVLVVVLTVRKVHWAGGTFYMDEYTFVFLFSQCIRCAQKRYCWESVRFASERSRVRIPLGPPICRIVLYDAAFFMSKKTLADRAGLRTLKSDANRVGSSMYFLKIHRFYASFFAFCRVLRASASLLCPLLGNSFKNFRAIVG